MSRQMSHWPKPLRSSRVPFHKMHFIQISKLTLTSRNTETSKATITRRFGACIRRDQVQLLDELGNLLIPLVEVLPKVSSPAVPYWIFTASAVVAA
jgi:hypothetical protein